MKIRTTLIILTLVIISACASKTPDPNLQIRAAVAGTLAAIPSATPPTLPTPYPTSTPMSLAGLFCEYQFCIGHPPEMAFLDGSAQMNPQAPSTYAQGILFAYNTNLVIQLIWQFAPGTKDSQFLLDLILKEADSRTGNMDAQLIHDMNVLYTGITSTASPDLPYGGAGAWNCGDRVFAWKVYTPEAISPESLFNNAIDRFTCNNK